MLTVPFTQFFMPNGPTVPAAVRKLLMEFDVEKFLAWKKAEEEDQHG